MNKQRADFSRKEKGVPETLGTDQEITVFDQIKKGEKQKASYEGVVNSAALAKQANLQSILTDLGEVLKKRKLPILIYHWEAWNRVPYKASVQSKSLTALGALVAGLYFWWAGQILMSLLVVAIFYIYYLIVTFKPIKVSHSIFSNGISTMGEFYIWDNLKDFWVGLKDGWYVIYVTTTLSFPKVLIMLANDKDIKDLVLVLGQFLPYRPKPKKQNFFELNMYGRYVPLEDILDETILTLDAASIAEKIENIIKKINKKYKSIAKEYYIKNNVV